MGREYTALDKGLIFLIFFIATNSIAGLVGLYGWRLADGNQE
jgi:hypothetical protein